jgi:asparagine synthase (glutamine-hydrolysing)
MCGITGIISFQKSNCTERVRSMTHALAHRGPDADGYYSDEQAYLGHRRLSIIDLSAESNQPIADNTGRYQLVFNGELYNYQEVRSLLSGYSFRTAGDTETVLAAYIRWGADCLKYLKGMFAFAIWDTQKQELFVVRDRLGVKPLYYFKNEQCFVFASEIRAILASNLVPKTLNREALLDYFAYQSFYTPHTPIKDIQQMPAASYLLVSASSFESKLYWDVTRPPAGNDFSDPAKVKKQIRHLLLQSVERRLVADVPVAAFLSGGIDSSAIVGLMAEVATTPQTFTIAYNEKEYDESAYAEIVAKKFKTHHHNILLKPAACLDELHHALSGMDSPSGDGINTYVVAKAIKQHGIKVALSGAGGDELFAGYPIFSQWLNIQQKKWLWKMPGVCRSLIAGLQGGNSSKALRTRQMLKLPQGDIASVYPVLRQVMPDALINKLTGLTTGRTSLNMLLQQNSEAMNALPLLSQVTAAEYFGYTQHTLLKDTDQMSMAVALEVREPFFDHELIEYVLQVPNALKKPTYPKSLLVESLNGLLPDEIVHRKKQGFLMPWAVWMKNELRGFCEEKINGMASRSFINGQALAKYWQRFLKGDQQVRWAELWLFIVLENWLAQNGINE